MPKPTKRRRPRPKRDEPAVMMSGLSMSGLTPERIVTLKKWSANCARRREQYLRDYA